MKSSEENVLLLGWLGLLSSTVGGGVGCVQGARHGVQMRRIASNTNNINTSEPNLIQRYSFSSAFKSQGRLALLHILAGPTIMLGRHAINNIALKCQGEEGRFSVGESMLCDFFLLPIGCTSLAYSAGYFLGISAVLKLSVGLEAIRRIF